MFPSAIESWRQRVASHHDQSLKALGTRRPPDDFWQGMAQSFGGDPYEREDPAVDRALQSVRPGDTVLDVGGGGGRFALPIAAGCRRVVVVEPSQSMVEVLRESTDAYGVSNVDVVHATWEEAHVDGADVVLCAHVLYGVEDVEPFVRKLHEHARREVLLPLFMRFPQHHLTPLWRVVHNEERIELPAMPELMNVLWEMDIYPNLDMLGKMPPRTFDSMESARDQLKGRLYVGTGSEEEARLGHALHHMLQPTPDGLVLDGGPARRLACAWWYTADDIYHA